MTRTTADGHTVTTTRSGDLVDFQVRAPSGDTIASVRTTLARARTLGLIPS